MRAPEELLDDSEASLRLVDQAIDELSSSMSASNFIVSAVGRATSVVDRLTAASDAERPHMLASLRAELNAIANHLRPPRS